MSVPQKNIKTDTEKSKTETSQQSLNADDGLSTTQNAYGTLYSTADISHPVIQQLNALMGNASAASVTEHQKWMKENPNISAEELKLKGDSQPNASVKMAYYDAAIQKNPNYAEAYFRRSFLYFRINATREALADLNKAIEINPNYTEARKERAKIAARDPAKLDKNHQLVEQAMADFNHVLSKDPEWKRGYEGRMMVRLNYFKKIRTKEEIEAMKQDCEVVRKDQKEAAHMSQAIVSTLKYLHTDPKFDIDFWITVTIQIGDLLVKPNSLQKILLRSAALQSNYNKFQYLQPVNNTATQPNTASSNNAKKGKKKLYKK